MPARVGLRVAGLDRLGLFCIRFFLVAADDAARPLDLAGGSASPVDSRRGAAVRGMAWRFLLPSGEVDSSPQTPPGVPLDLLRGLKRLFDPEYGLETPAWLGEDTDE